MMVVDGTGQEEPLTSGNVSQYNRIDHNYFHDINNTGGNNWEAMRIGRSWQGPTKGFNVIEHNLLTRATGDPETISRQVLGQHRPPQHHARHQRRDSPCATATAPRSTATTSWATATAARAGMRVYGADHRIYNNYVAAASTGIWLDAGGGTPTDEPGKEHYRVYRAWVFNNTVIGQTIRVGRHRRPTSPRTAGWPTTSSGGDQRGHRRHRRQEGNTVRQPADPAGRDLPERRAAPSTRRSTPPSTTWPTTSRASPAPPPTSAPTSSRRAGHHPGPAHHRRRRPGDALAAHVHHLR